MRTAADGMGTAAPFLAIIGSFVLAMVLIATAVGRPAGELRVIGGVGSLYYHLDPEYRVADATFGEVPTTVQVADIGPIPADATAVSYKIAAYDTYENGHASFSPGTSVLNWEAADVTMNAGIIQVQSLNVPVAASTPVHLTIDIVGYFRLAE